MGDYGVHYSRPQAYEDMKNIYANRLIDMVQEYLLHEKFKLQRSEKMNLELMMKYLKATAEMSEELNGLHLASAPPNLLTVVRFNKMHFAAVAVIDSMDDGPAKCSS